MTEIWRDAWRVTALKRIARGEWQCVIEKPATNTRLEAFDKTPEGAMREAWKSASLLRDLETGTK